MREYLLPLATISLFLLWWKGGKIAGKIFVWWLLSSRPKENHPTIDFSGSPLKIQYQHGVPRQLYIPYSRKEVMPMMFLEAEGYFLSSPPINITQEPGIPYLISAEELGAEYIRITNLETSSYHDYYGSVRPFFAPEVSSLSQE